MHCTFFWCYRHIRQTNPNIKKKSQKRLMAIPSILTTMWSDSTVRTLTEPTSVIFLLALRQLTNDPDWSRREAMDGPDGRGQKSIFTVYHLNSITVYCLSCCCRHCCNFPHTHLMANSLILTTRWGDSTGTGHQVPDPHPNNVIYQHQYHHTKIMPIRLASSICIHVNLSNFWLIISS